MKGDEGRWREMKADAGKWREMKGDESRWKEMKADEGRWREMKVDEEKWSEMKGDEGTLWRLMNTQKNIIGAYSSYELLCVNLHLRKRTWELLSGCMRDGKSASHTNTANQSADIKICNCRLYNPLCRTCTMHKLQNAKVNISYQQM